MESTITTTSISTETATKYLQYLTGSVFPGRALQIMTGTKKIYRGKDGVTFDIHGSMHRTPIVHLKYNVGEDLFELSFWRSGNPVREFKGLFAEDLKSVFEDYTGLYLSIPRIHGINA